MKKYIFVIALLTLGVISFVWAAPKGDPFSAVWDAVNNLQTQINNIQLTPGPQGEQGPIGLTGPQGITGAGDVAFIYFCPNGGFWILKTDGKVYQWHGEVNSWSEETYAEGIPISISDIIQWQRNMFLDKDGNVWTLYDGWNIVNP